MLGLSVIILFKSLLHVFCSLVFSAHNSSATRAPDGANKLAELTNASTGKANI